MNGKDNTQYGSIYGPYERTVYPNGGVYTRWAPGDPGTGPGAWGGGAMNRQTRTRLQQYRSLCGRVPFPIAEGGTQSASFLGFVTYAQDMRQFEPAMCRALTAILLTDAHAPPEVIDDDPDQVLTAITAWLAGRDAAGWQLPVPPLTWAWA